MTLAVTFIPGDGPGPELAAAARRALDATGAGLAWDEPEEGAAVESVRRTGAALRGPGGDGDGALAAGLGLYAEIVPLKAFEGVRTRFPETDLVLVREHGDPAVAFREEERVVRAAHEYARAHDRGDVAVPGGDIGELCASLVSSPEAHDVIVLPSLYGGIVGHLGAGMVGGLGVAPAVALGTDAAVFEVAHGSVANPTALMLAGALLLRHLGQTDAAERLTAALAAVIRRGEQVTYDLKPTPNDPTAVGAEAFADAVIQEMNTT